MVNWFWNMLARVLATDWVYARIHMRAMRTPYSHIRGKDGSLYMGRWWLFNRYDQKPRDWWREWLPSVRLHWIRRHDGDRHLHDHPWNARSIVLNGYYYEVREGCDWRILRAKGTSAPIKFGEFHRITNVPELGVWTLFITWRYRGRWGFKVGNEKVPYDIYLAERDK